MRSWTGIPELREAHRGLGAARFWSLLLGVLAWCLLGAWLSISLDYPHVYGSACRRRCLIEEFWFSPALARHGTALDYALFAYIWAVPLLATAIVIRSALRKRRLEARDRILPMNPSDPE